MANVHGLAASIRSAQDSEVFDLAGQNASSIQQTIRSAFSEPFEIQEMIRITLITGAGKLARQKYDDGAARAVSSVLTQLGFEEDRGASGTLDCAGTFKIQHDTGKNLKTVVVYPIVAVTKNTTSALQEDSIPSLVPTNSPDYKIAMSSMSVFRNIVTNKCPTWTDKKGCLTCIENLQNLLEELEDKLCKGTMLDASENDFYNKVTDLGEKQAYIKKCIQEQVFEKGQITEKERKTLLDMIAERITSLQSEHKSVVKVLQRKEALLDITPISPYPLKHESEIRKIVKEKLLPIEKLEQTSKGRLLTLKETQIFSKKDDLLDLIQQYELASRGWFEDDETFQSRLQHSRQHRYAVKKKKAQTSYSTNTSMKITSSTSAVNKWILPGNTKTQSFTTTKKSKIKGPDVFSAMMMDSSDEEDDKEELKMQSPKVNCKKPLIDPNQLTITQQDFPKKEKTKKANVIIEEKTTEFKKSPVASIKLIDENNCSSHASLPHDEPNQKKKSKKKKKKTKKNSESEVCTQVVATPEKVNENQVSEKSENNPHITIIILMNIFVIMRDYLVPLLLTTLTWILGQLLGTKKQKKGSKKR